MDPMYANLWIRPRSMTSVAQELRDGKRRWRGVQVLGLPAVLSLDRVGLAVPDIEEAPRFLMEVPGCKLLRKMAPIMGRGNGCSTT